jgi:hypothetical protein
MAKDEKKEASGRATGDPMVDSILDLCAVFQALAQTIPALNHPDVQALLGGIHERFTPEVG